MAPFQANSENHISRFRENPGTQANYNFCDFPLKIFNLGLTLRNDTFLKFSPVDENQSIAKIFQFRDFYPSD